MQKVLVFDFDGVIVRGSERAKEIGWKIFEKQGATAVAAVAAARERYSKGRGSRYEIVRDVLRDLGEPEDRIPVLVEEYCEQYNTVVQAAIVAEHVHPDDLATLKQLQTYHRLYINSATPEIPMRQTVEKLGIDTLFVGVFGQPTKKPDILKKIAELENIPITEAIFVGDGSGDFEAAQAVGCHFVGIANADNRWHQTVQSFSIADSVHDAVKRFLL